MSLNKGMIGPLSLLNSLKKFNSLSSPYISFLVLLASVIPSVNKTICSLKVISSRTKSKSSMIPKTSPVSIFKYLNIDTGLVLGIMEDFDFVREEITLREQIVLFTDGITDASNTKNEMYGEDKLLNFFNEFKSDKGPIMPLLSDIHEFTRDAEQFDDMTVLYLKIKD